jgi:hypothetical protein
LTRIFSGSISAFCLPPQPETILAAVAVIFLWFGLRPPVAQWRQWLTIITASLLAIVALANAAQFYLLLANGSIVPRLPIALSLGVALGLGCIAWTVRRVEKATVDLPDLCASRVMLLMWMGLFPFSKRFASGKPITAGQPMSPWCLARALTRMASLPTLWRTVCARLANFTPAVSSKG